MALERRNGKQLKVIVIARHEVPLQSKKTKNACLNAGGMQIASSQAHGNDIKVDCNFNDKFHFFFYIICII